MQRPPLQQPRAGTGRTTPPPQQPAAAQARQRNGGRRMAGGSGGAAAAASPRPPPAIEEAAVEAPANSAVAAGEALGGGSTLRQDVEGLRQQLAAQSRLVQQQQETIRQLQAVVEQLASSQGNGNGASSGGSSSSTGAQAPAATAASPPGQQQQQQQQQEGLVLLPGQQQQQEGGLVVVPGGGMNMVEAVLAEEKASNAQMAGAAIFDRRLSGLFDARYHSTSFGATPRDFRILPQKIILVRHAESEGNVDNVAYTYLPDPKVPLTARGWQQALDAGDKIRTVMDAEASPYKLFFYTSPYLRSKQTYEGVAQAFERDQVQGAQEEVQLREQDFGNFQDTEGKKREKAERLRFGRFFYRFPNGESGADVYDRMTIFEDHLVRDINAGRFADNSALVLVTHGLALRIFLMRWFHWTVDQFMGVYNPPNAEPLVLERIASDWESRQGGPAAWMHTKSLYRLTDSSREIIRGCTSDMCTTSYAPRVPHTDI